MKKVALVNGLTRQVKYNQHLAKKYENIGFSVKEFFFPSHLLFRTTQHHRLENMVKEIVQEHDVIHCQSGGYFPVVHYYYEQEHTKPFILETPVVRATPGTFFSAMGISKSYETAPDSAIVQKFLDVVCFKPEWRELTIKRLQALKDRKLTFALASTADAVSDNRGQEHLLDHHFPVGKHARLFYDNDFEVIAEYLRKHPSLLKKL